MSLNNILIEAVKEAKDANFEKIELVEEDNDVELYFIQGEQGIGRVNNDIKDELRTIKRKDIQKLKKDLNVKDIKLKEYQHFGDWARKIEIFI